MIGHKISLNKFKQTEFISSIFSNHDGIKLEITYMKKTEKFTNMEIKQQMGQRRNQREIKKYLQTNTNGNAIYQSSGTEQKQY